MATQVPTSCDSSSFSPRAKQQPWGLSQHSGVTSPEECQAACCTTSGCSTWTWSNKANQCFLGNPSHFTPSDDWSGGQRDGGEVWQKKLQVAKGEDAAVAVLLFNPMDTANVTVAVNFTALGLDPNKHVVVRDLWEHREQLAQDGAVRATLLPHAAAMLRLSQRPAVAMVI